MLNPLFDLLKCLNFSVSKRYLDSLLQSHPNFPSLLSIADSLERLGIKYKVTRVKRDRLIDLEFPFLLFLQKGHGELSFVKNAKMLEDKESEIKYWNGIVLLVDSKSNILNSKNDTVLRNEKATRLIVFIFLFSVVGLIFTQASQSFHFSISTALLLLTSIAGIFIGYLLVAKELGVNYQAIEIFCNSGTNTNCDKLIRRDSTKLFGLITFSDATLIYFIFQTLTIVFFQQFAVLALLSILTIPIFVYSLYYQHFVVKAWCRLCLMVDVLLVLQLILFYRLLLNNILQFNDFQLISVINVSFVLAAVGSIILFGKKVFKNESVLRRDLSKAKRVVNSPSVFMHLLGKERKIDDSPLSQEVIIGNTDAPIKLMIVSNLFCNPCREQHDIAANLIENFPDKISLSIRFTRPSRDESSVQYLLQSWLQSRNSIDCDYGTNELVSRWFDLMDVEKFKKAIPLKTEAFSERSYALANEHFSWVKKIKVTKTPTIFINGFEFPSMYEIRSLRGLIPLINKEHIDQLSTVKESKILFS